MLARLPFARLWRLHPNGSCGCTIPLAVLRAGMLSMVGDAVVDFPGSLKVVCYLHIYRALHLL